MSAMERRGPWTVIGAPIDSAGRAIEEAMAPTALRRAGLVERIGARDLGDFGTPLREPVRHPNGVLGYDDVVEFSRALRQPIADTVEDGERPLVLGGDCSLLIGAFAGLRAGGRRAGLWFVDGHADFYDGASSPSGEAADMELAILTGHGAPGLVDLAGEPPMLDPSEVLILGHRPAASGDDVAEELGFVPEAIRRWDATEVREGATGLGRKADRLLSATGGAWLHIDLDVLDSDLFPAISYPQPGGIDWDELTALVAPLAASPALVGASIADLNPARDPDGSGAVEVVKRLAPLLGARS
jgi:arginase